MSSRPEELYGLTEDPHELDNLLAGPSTSPRAVHAGDRLRDRLAARMRARAIHWPNGSTGTVGEPGPWISPARDVTSDSTERTTLREHVRLPERAFAGGLTRGRPGREPGPFGLLRRRAPA